MIEKRVVVLGAGSGGVSAALRFERLLALRPKGVEVTLVDQRNYHLFLPLLYQVATGGVEPGHICFPIRSLLRRGGTLGPVKFQESRVLEVDLKRRVVATDDGPLPWDYLVFALGSTTNFFGLPGVEQNVLTLKSLSEGIAVHNRIVDSFEAALLEHDEEKRRELLTFVTVGGGATGVELTSSIEGFVCKVMSRDFPPLTPLARVVLIEAGDRLLRGMGPGMGDVAYRRLRSLGVEVLLDTRVARAFAGGVETADGQTIRSRNVIWVAGVRPVSLAQALPGDRARDGRIVVSEHLEVPGWPGLYVVGDSAYLEHGAAGPYPPTGQIAVRHGVAAAENVTRAILGQPRQPFRYKYKGELISMGRSVAVAQVGPVAFSGFAAWLLWRTYYLRKLMGFRNRLSVAVDWAFDYFYRRNTARFE